MLNFQEMIATLSQFWTKQGCLVHQGYDLEVGAGTFNPATFLRCLGPEPYSAVYVEPSRRPQDGRYGKNPNRVQHYHQMQVIMKPSPPNIQDLYLQSLQAIGLNLEEHDIRFVHDDWENPTIGAWGLGWEIWLDGMEVTQFTYFQAVGGLPVKPVSGEITYGLERLAMYLQGVNSIFDIKWNDQILYGDIFQRSEWEWSFHNFHEANAEMWLRHFDDFEKETRKLIAKGLPIPAYDYVMKTSHAFNILDARGVISVTERTGYIARIRNLAKELAIAFIESREKQNFPLMRNSISKKEIPPAKTIHFSFDPKKTQDFLLEIGSEELPATFVPIGMHQLEKAIKAIFQENDLSFKNIEVFGTPRRLSVIVKDLVEGSAAQKIERKGPSIAVAFNPDGTLTEVGKGFLKSLKIETNLQLNAIKKGHTSLKVEKVKDVDYLFATIEKAGISTQEILTSHLPQLILRLDFPKKMRWGSLEIEYARPLRWIVALFGSQPLHFTVGDIQSGTLSYGHRQLAPESFTLFHPHDYVATLEKHKVMAGVEKRKEAILNQLKKVEENFNVTTLALEKVLPQVLHLVEWPFVTVGSFDPSYLKAPKEILISEMVEHQKYFPLANKEGTLEPKFAIVCNNTPNEIIRKGNEKALTPRLADGLFLYEEDLKVPMEQFCEKLKSVTFQKELGSVAAKVKRLTSNVEILQASLGDGNLTLLKRAATLSKADLVTQLVGEFPELQGLVGKFYALHANENEEVATAIDEQWMPRGEKSPLPITKTGTILSLSDKIDNLLSCFSLGLLPTSSSDPYALRRQALGIIKMVIQNKYCFNLKMALSACFDAFLLHSELKEDVRKTMRDNKEKTLEAILDFIMNRLRSVFLELGYAKDESEAVLSHGCEDIYHSYRLLDLLHDFRKSHREHFLDLLHVHTRAKKMLGSAKGGSFNPSLLKEESEKTLFRKIEELKKNPLGDEKTFSRLFELKAPLDALFDSVKILDENPEIASNRLALLREVCGLCTALFDLSKIQEHVVT